MMKKRLLSVLFASCLGLGAMLALTACGGTEPPASSEKTMQSVNVEVVNSNLLSKYEESTKTFTYAYGEWRGISEGDFLMTATYDDGSTEGIFGFGFMVSEELYMGTVPISETPYQINITYEAYTFDYYVQIVPATVEKPTALNNDTFTYDGYSKYVDLGDYSYEKITITGNEQTNAGTYTAVVTLQEGYQWSDGTTEPVELTWTIEKALVQKPQVDESIERRYAPDSPQQPYFIDGTFDYSTMELVGDGAVVVGTHNAVVRLLDSTNYAWAGEESTVTEISLPWTIYKAQLLRPTLSASEFVYNTGERDLTDYLNFDFGVEEAVTISGHLATNANAEGEHYTMTIALNDTDNYEWENETIETLSFDWTIVPCVLSDYYTPWLENLSDCVYDKTEKTINVYTYDEGMYYKQTEDSVTSATDHGTYYVKFDLLDKSNYRWSDGTTDLVVLSWTIEKRTFSKLTQSEIPEFIFDNTEKQVLNYWVSGANLEYFDVTGNTGTKAKDYTATVSFREDVVNSCEWEDGTVEDVEYEWKINQRRINVYSAENVTYTYTGEEQEFAFYIPDMEYYEKYTVIANNKQTDAVTDKEVTLSLMYPEDTYWNDEERTSDPKIYLWTIQPKKVDVPTVKADVTYTYNTAQQTVELEGVVEEYMSASNRTQTNAGTHYATVTLTSANYAWKNLEAEQREVQLAWVIEKMLIAKPTASEQTFTYDSFNHSYNPVGYDQTTMTISGNVEKFAGAYTTSVALADKDNYAWADSTQDDVTFAWSIAKKKVALPIAGEEMAFVYDGTEKTPEYQYLVNIITLTGDLSAVNAGDYALNFTLNDNDNYQWDREEDVNGVAVISWVIFKASIDFYDPNDHYGTYDFASAWTGTYNTYYDGTKKTVVLDLPNAELMDIIYEHKMIVDADGNNISQVVTDLSGVGTYVTTATLTIKEEYQQNYKFYFGYRGEEQPDIYLNWKVYSTTVDLDKMTEWVFETSFADFNNYGAESCTLKYGPSYTVSLYDFTYPGVTVLYQGYVWNEEEGVYEEYANGATIDAIGKYKFVATATTTNENITVIGQAEIEILISYQA